MRSNHDDESGKETKHSYLDTIVGEARWGKGNSWVTLRAEEEDWCALWDGDTVNEVR